MVLAPPQALIQICSSPTRGLPFWLKGHPSHRVLHFTLLLSFPLLAVSPGVAIKVEPSPSGCSFNLALGVAIMVDPSPQSPFVFQIPCSSPLRGAQHFGSIPKRNKHAGMQLDRVPLRIPAQGYCACFFPPGDLFFCARPDCHC